MIKFISDFLWGTFNYRNKGMPLKGYIQTGYNFARISRNSRKERAAK